ncbi:unnamed protein product, partial [Prorocentrum cordatum]
AGAAAAWQRLGGACGQGPQPGATPAAARGRARSALRLRLPAEVRALYGFADGQDLLLHWRGEAAHPVRGKWWAEAGYNPKWFPIGFNESKHVALCVSTVAGRVTRFTTPDGQVSHATEAHKHLNEGLRDYLEDLDDYLAGKRQPFIGLGIRGPAA